MKMPRTTPPTSRTLTLLAAAALALLAACGTTPPHNTQVDSARSAYRAAEADPQTRDGAPAEMRQAAEALARADAALARRDDMASVDHLAYQVQQHVALAQSAGSRKAAEASVAQASAERDRLRLDARTREADAATRDARASQDDARASQAQAQYAEREARIAQQQSLASQQQANAAEQQAGIAQQQAGQAQQDAQAAQQRMRMLEDQLRDLDAKKTSRGMVITIGDVLFDSGRSELKSGGQRGMDKLAGFLQAYPQRRAMVEGFTDSVGNEGMNQDLSARRAEAVRSALVSRGVDAGRIGTQGYGESFPVAGNDSAGGRQMNRRVEVVLSEDNGVVSPR